MNVLSVASFAASSVTGARLVPSTPVSVDFGSASSLAFSRALAAAADILIIDVPLFSAHSLFHIPARQPERGAVLLVDRIDAVTMVTEINGARLIRPPCRHR